MRETILSGCIDSVRSRDDESHVDIDQLIVDYLSEIDETTDEQMEERKKQKKEWEANVLARNALEEFERLVDGEN